MPSSNSPLRAREVIALVLGAAAVALLMHWPLPLHLGRDVARDIGDPLVQAWQVAWGGHALVEQPLDFFQANTFWPERNSLAFSEALAGYAPAGAVGSGFEAAIVRYNVLFLAAYALCFVGAYLLARELGAGRAGGAVAGAAFAYAPWRLEQDGHLHVISSGGIPLALFLLVRGYRRRRPATVVAGWLVAAWQLSLGFTLGLPLAYLLGALAVVAAVPAIRSRAMPPRPLLVATAVGVATFCVVGVLLSRPYVEVVDDHPEAQRTSAQVAGLSPPLKAFLAAPEQNFVWGKVTHGVREELPSIPEQTLFPGIAILSLSLAGLLAPTYDRRLRLGLAVAALAFAVLSLGFREHASHLWPYRWLYDLAPGWEGVRAPGRINTLTSLALALLAAAGAQRLIGGWPAAGPARARIVRAALAVVLVAAILVEGAGFDLGPDGLDGPSHPRVPKPPAASVSEPAPRLHLPITVAANRRYVLWSVDGFPKIVNGRGSFLPRPFVELAGRVRDFPGPRAVATLNALGVRTVVLHTDLASGTPWEKAAVSPQAAGVRSQRRGRLIVYRLR